MFGWTTIIAAHDDSAFLVCALAIVAIVVWVVVRRRHPLQITVEHGQVTEMRGIAKAQTHRVVSFLERDVAIAGKVKVLGGRDANGVLRINFLGDVDEGTRQQIRNYLKLIL